MKLISLLLILFIALIPIVALGMGLFVQSIMPPKQGGDSGIRLLRKYNTWSETLALLKIGLDAKAAYKKRTKGAIKSSSPTAAHVASPEVVADEKSQKIRLYFHGVVEGSLQKSKVALSDNGIDFEPLPQIITLPYLRFFSFRDAYYGFAMPGFFYRSADGLTNFEVRKRWLLDTNARHAGLYLTGNDLYVFYTRVGDHPERILYTRVDLSPEDWKDWKAAPARELLRPEQDWEAVYLPAEPSLRGEISIPVNQLRDPDIFQDLTGDLYLIYAGGGEQGIGIAALTQH